MASRRSKPITDKGKGSKEEEATQEPELDLYGSEITDEKSVQ